MSEREHPPTTKLSASSLTWLLACRLPAWLPLELARLLLLLPLLRLLRDSPVS